MPVEIILKSIQFDSFKKSTLKNPLKIQKKMAEAESFVLTRVLRVLNHMASVFNRHDLWYTALLHKNSYMSHPQPI